MYSALFNDKSITHLRYSIPKSERFITPKPYKKFI